RIWIIRSKHHLTHARDAHEVSQRFSGEDQRIEIHSLQVFRRLLLELLVALFGKRHASMIGAVRIGRKITTPVSRADLEFRKPVERAFEDQMGKRDCRSKRIADHICKNAVTLESRSKLRNALRMKKDRCIEFFCLCPERIEVCGSQLLACDCVANRAATQSE